LKEVIIIFNNKKGILNIW